MMWLLLPAFAEEPKIEVPDRSHAPDVLAPVPLELDDLERHELGEGLEVWHVRVPRLRKATIEVTWWAGRVDLSDQKQSAHSVVGSVWDVASEKYDSAELSELADVLDMTLWGYLGDHQMAAGVQVPLDELDKGLDVLADVALHPAFPGREIKLDKEQTVRFFEILGPASPRRIVGSALTYAWNPADHPYGYRPDPDAYSKVKRGEVFAVHEQMMAEGPVSILVVGDLSWEDVEERLKTRFGTLGAAGERSEVLDAPVPTQTRVIAVAVPDAEQVSIRMRQSAPARTDERNAAMEAVSYALGGHFLARLNKNLREDKGWTYGVGAWYSAGRKRGSFNVSVDVPADKFAPAVTEIEKEIATIAAEGTTDEEIDAWWRADVMQFNKIRGTIDDAYSFYSNNLEEQETVADALARIDAADKMTVARTAEVASEVLSADAPRIWVVVGPKDAIVKGVDALEWEVEWISPKDAILGRFEGGL